MLRQVEAFQHGKSERADRGVGQRLSLLRVGWPALDDEDRAEKLRLANGYYERFDKEVQQRLGSISAERSGWRRQRRRGLASLGSNPGLYIHRGFESCNSRQSKTGP